MINTFNAEWLLLQDFPPLQYAIPGLIPEGMSLLVGGPKAGKSWFVLDLGYAAATGGAALGGIPVDQRPVLYLALEDGQRRLQSRLRRLGYTHGGADLHFVVAVDKEHPPEHVISKFLEGKATQAPLVILDTLGKVMPPPKPSEGAYERDYRVAGGLKALVDAHPGSSLIVVHHTNKAAHGDFVDKVSGTNGIAGAADSILVLARERDDTNATLSVTSRDAAEGIYQLAQPEVGRWELVGGSLDDARNAYQQAKATERLDDNSLAIVELVNNRGKQGLSTTAADVAEALNWEGPEGKKKAGTYLGRLSTGTQPAVRRSARGVYDPAPIGGVESVGSVESTSTHDSNSTLPTLSTTHIQTPEEEGEAA